MGWPKNELPTRRFKRRLGMKEIPKKKTFGESLKFAVSLSVLTVGANGSGQRLMQRQHAILMS